MPNFKKKNALIFNIKIDTFKKIIIKKNSHVHILFPQRRGPNLFTQLPNYCVELGFLGPINLVVEHTHLICNLAIAKSKSPRPVLNQ